MKRINNSIVKSIDDRKVNFKNLKISSFLLLFLVAFTFMGCDLQPQQKFKFDPEVAPQVTFGSMTVWEWLQTNPKGEFGFMIEAIKQTGLQDLYNSKTVKYTFFLMKNPNWTNNGPGLFNKEFGLRNTANREPADVFADPKVDLDIVRNALLHLVLDEYVDQGPNHLKSLDVQYTFNTLSEDVNNKTMTISRDWNYNMQLNSSPDLPGGNLGKINVPIGFHNYIFSDGNCVAHIFGLNGNGKMSRRYKFGKPLFEL